jgi:hypothetical protein
MGANVSTGLYALVCVFTAVKEVLSARRAQGDNRAVMVKEATTTVAWSPVISVNLNARG